jgi:hypothetical protein
MNRNYNIAEILESVDVLTADNIYKVYDKNKIIYRYKKFNNKNIDMSDNPKTEKIIIDAEQSLKNKDMKYNTDKSKQSPLILNTVASSNLDLSEPLILEKEFIEDEKNLEDYKELENNYNNEIKLLQSENIKQQEIIKDLNILLYDFKKQKRYSDLDDKIKLYQKDNNALRKKMFDFSATETNLRLQLSKLTAAAEMSKNKIFEENNKSEKQEINKLNIQIEHLSQKNNQLQSELSSLQKDKGHQSTDVDQKIKFYREEYAKIIVDKSDVQKKLEIAKNQLFVNEKNKIELKLALENLNQILASSNIETKIFNNENEEFTNKTRKEK